MRDYRVILSLTVLIILFVHKSQAKIASAKLESCPGCSLNRNAEVKAFAYEDLPKYGIEFKKIQGHSPELVFFDEDDNEVERHPLSKLTRKQCIDLLESRGFHLIKEL